MRKNLVGRTLRRSVVEKVRGEWR